MAKTIKEINEKIKRRKDYLIEVIPVLAIGYLYYVIS